VEISAGESQEPSRQNATKRPRLAGQCKGEAEDGGALSGGPFAAAPKATGQWPVGFTIKFIAEPDRNAGTFMLQHCREARLSCKNGKSENDFYDKNDCIESISRYGANVRLGPRLSAKLVVPVERIELPTFGLQNRCSTAELNRRTL
jgi:hypothetical protein